MLIAAGILSLTIWVYLLLGRGQFWRITGELPAGGKQLASARIAVVIPARDEADVVGRAVRSLLDQEGLGALHIFLVDDCSSDGTAQLARRAAVDVGRAEMLTVITGRPLPPGWSGKMWALHQGVLCAPESHPDFFLFTDADIVHDPTSVARMVSIARNGSFDLVSFMVKLHCETLPEKLLIPAFVFFFFKLYPPAWNSDPGRSTAGAAGGCILIAPKALDEAGGIEAIRSEVIDDCALAARVKGRGGRTWLAASRTAASVRPYTGFLGIGRMVSRSAFNQLGHSPVLLLVSLAGLLATYVVPPLLAVLSHRQGPVLLGAVAWFLMVLSYLPVLRLYRLGPWWGLALPLIAVFYMGATVHSAFKYWSGEGGEWKGRVQDPAGDRG